MKRPLTVVAAGVAAAAAFFLAPVIPAHAALVTTCIGDAGAVTVPGDLVVPDGQSCVMTGTTVTGKVTVGVGSDLIVTDGTFQGAVTINSDGYLDMTNTTVKGQVSSKGGYGTYASGSSLYAYTETGSSAGDSFLYVENSKIPTSIVTKGASVYLLSSSARSLTSTNDVYADVIDSTVTGKVTVTAARFGSNVCGSEVDGDATFQGVGGVQLGSGSLFGDCAAGPNYFGGGVKINGSTVGVELNDNIIRGNLSGTGNTPAPTGSNNRVRGTSTGQFAELSAGAARAALRSAPANHLEDLQSKVAERRAANNA